MDKKIKIVFLSGVMLISSTAQVQAATATTTMLVTATVLTSCLVTALPLAFGNYDPSSVTDRTTTTTTTVTCTGVANNYTLAMNAGTGSGATVAARKMTFGASTLNYSVYTTAAHTTVWGDGTAGTGTVTGNGVLGVTNHTVYGVIPAGQSPNAGAYSDTINITLTY
ncbi:MAG: spore coat U domain-containing protein [Methylophilaceae bacterium]